MTNYRHGSTARWQSTFGSEDASRLINTSENILTSRPFVVRRSELRSANRLPLGRWHSISHSRNFVAPCPRTNDSLHSFLVHGSLCSTDTRTRFPCFNVHSRSCFSAPRLGPAQLSAFIQRNVQPINDELLQPGIIRHRQSIKALSVVLQAGRLSGDAEDDHLGDGLVDLMVALDLVVLNLESRGGSGERQRRLVRN